MRQILTEEWLEIPSDVTVTIKSRIVTVKGPRGLITKDLSHISVEMTLLKTNAKKQAGKFIRFRMWFGALKQACSVRTALTIIENMFKGVTEGFLYKMRLVHAHFPINAGPAKDGKSIEIKNFLGGRHIKKIILQPGVTVKTSADVKDELIFEGIDNAGVSLSCAQISQSCKIGTKDERKFLDGIFVSEKTVIKARE